MFHIDIDTWPACAGDMQVIGCIEDPAVIKRILAHLDPQGKAPAACVLLQPQAPPANPRAAPVCTTHVRSALLRVSELLPNPP